MRRAPSSLTAAIASIALGLGLVACSGDDGGQTPSTPEPVPTTVVPEPPPTAPPVTGRSVHVVDGDTGEPIADANVRVRGPGVRTSVRTGADGTAPLPEGAALVRVRAPGREEARATVRRRQPTTVNLYDPALQSPQYGGGPERTRYLPRVEVPVPRRGPAWSFDARTLIEFPPAVKNGIAVFGVNSGRVFALDTDTGEVKWARRQRGEIAATPAIAGNRVYVASMDGQLSAYRLTDGARLWQFSTDGSPIETSPLVVDDEIYFGTWSGRLYSLDLRTADVRWTFQASADIKGSAVQVDGNVVVGDYRGNMYSLDRRDGSLDWTYTGGVKFYGGPGLSGDTLVIGDVGGSVHAVDARTGNGIWRFGTGNYVYASPAIANGTVYIGSYDQNLYALDLADGSVKWRFDAGERISGSATVVGDTVYASVLYGPGEPKRTYGLDAQDGSVVFRSDDGRYSPAVAAGTTLFLAGSRTLYGYPARRR